MILAGHAWESGWEILVRLPLMGFYGRGAWGIYPKGTPEIMSAKTRIPHDVELYLISLPQRVMLYEILSIYISASEIAWNIKQCFVTRYILYWEIPKDGNSTGARYTFVVD